MPAASWIVPASVCAPSLSEPTLNVATAPESIGITEGAPSSVPPVTDAMSSLAVIVITFAVATIEPLPGDVETTIGTKLSIRTPAITSWLVLPTASLTTARRS